MTPTKVFLTSVTVLSQSTLTYIMGLSLEMGKQNSYIRLLPFHLLTLWFYLYKMTSTIRLLAYGSVSRLDHLYTDLIMVLFLEMTSTIRLLTYGSLSRTDINESLTYVIWVSLEMPMTSLFNL